jgi:hypothetical protein
MSKAVLRSAVVLILLGIFMVLLSLTEPLTQTTVSEGQRARACSSNQNSTFLVGLRIARPTPSAIPNPASKRVNDERMTCSLRKPSRFERMPSYGCRSFLAARFPAACASASHMYAPRFVLP